MTIIKITETDRRILRYLLRDGRQPIAQLARRLGLSESAVRHRINRLTENEVIRRFTVSLDYSLLGYPVTVIVGINIGGMPGAEVANALRQIDNIVDIFTVTGEYDMLVRVICENIDCFEPIIEQIRNLDFVEQTRSFVVINRVRDGDYDNLIKVTPPR